MKNAAPLLKLFQNKDSQPLVAKPGQLDIFNVIVNRYPRRNACVCYTRYGKSLFVALGVLIRAAFCGEKWVIIAPTKEKAQLIMSYVIEHIFDSQYFLSKLEMDSTLDRLRRERRKDYLTFRGGGRIYTLSADAKNEKRIGKLLGEGSPNIIEDEAPLIPDKIHAMVMRMLGDSADNFLFKIGNAFENNHFKRSMQNSNYNHIVVDCYKGLEESKLLPYDEGRLTQETIDEARQEPFFEQLYECKFVAGVAFNEKGFLQLLTEDDIKAAKARKKNTDGRPRLGVDIGRGSDRSMFVLRYPHYAQILEWNQDRDLMSQVPRIIKYMEQYNIEPQDVSIDDIGVGGGVTDRLRELDYPVMGIASGSEAQDSEKFANLRAEMGWELKLWIQDPENALESRSEWDECTEVGYKENSSRKLILEPKEDIRKRISKSPDAFDALALTFSPQDVIPELIIV